MGIPMHNTNTAGVGLPRRASAIAAYGPGNLLIPDKGRQPTDLGVLQPGDLVFFAIIKNEPNVIDHCGMYLGLDNADRPRFCSSRSAANGPTMGDLAGHAVLDGTRLLRPRLPRRPPPVAVPTAPIPTSTARRTTPSHGHRSPCPGKPSRTSAGPTPPAAATPSTLGGTPPRAGSARACSACSPPPRCSTAGA
ncbi:hypothetical protein ACFWJ5_07920 [Streptomyces qaidamensis]|uniref:hypothetical protein n=1 Tax=Streptomyces qaidamensis TaxID=1783515 RepID=UPI00365E74E9